MTSDNSLVSRRLTLFPISTAVHPEKDVLQIDGLDLSELAEEYGTPLYLYDQATILDAIHKYRQALLDEYPAPSGLTYAAKAYLCLAIAQWISAQGLHLDCSSANELLIAQQAGVPRSQIVLHGVNKRPQDLSSAIDRSGILVVDHLAELDQLIELFRQKPPSFPEIWLRWRPGLGVQTHSYAQTAQTTSKFGFSTEEIFRAVQSCIEAGLPLTGLHFHLGSNYRDLVPLSQAVHSSVMLLAALRTALGWTAKYLSPGGGLGIAYHEDDLPEKPISDYVQTICSSLIESCRAFGLPLPHLQLEPGRSLIGRAGVALYRIGATKQAGDRQWYLLDGGLADNPRVALYGTRYSGLPFAGLQRPIAGSYWLGGPACESGDILAEALPLPALSPGELLAIPASGAYQLSMSSRYNGALRPAVLWLAGQTAQLIQVRETPEDLIRHDRLLNG
jgi:diaminopimelate decarboxylase